ncbi:HlyD family type I secretion periplasmic adaptor subunit [Aliiroseovarius subalbicans]|uniref:HlyD family type I secretion periplasmic adaptor subunit n=1 Tax=Aliiroseovarius subalbicans TaxID=2925840 RepID=UPI001F5901A9|nr:HlyD family type I secretion periplasmic adaptor subunit [Aliiroseovarius subalbicans]MCI2401171.1 HlyD family type I secretion periplasmic adaptor subunit [Aliiroseovarius subalbicans]
MTKHGQDSSAPRTGLTRVAHMFWWCSALLLSLLLIWAEYTHITGAVIASGQIVVRGKPKVVQSLDGGIVADIQVQDGDLVEEGQLLLRLDPTLLNINRDVYRNRLAEIVARQSRLEAEYQGLKEITQRALIEQLDGMEMEPHYAGQAEVFKARREVLEGRKAQFEERVSQFQNQIEGVEGLIASKKDQLVFVRQELENARKLYQQRLTRESAVLDLQRSEAILLGELTEHQSELARIHNLIHDARLEILQAEREFKEQAVTELRDVTSRYEDLLLEIVSIEKQLERIDVIAPVNGVVHELQVFTIGGVVTPESVIMQIVPVSEGMEFEVRVDPTDINQIHLGQTAKIQLPAFDMKTTPILLGEITRISANTLQDELSGRAYYSVTVVLREESEKSLGPVPLVPGMPVEAFMETGQRSVLSYLTKPLTDQLKRAFRES